MDFVFVIGISLIAMKLFETKKTAATGETFLAPTEREADFGRTAFKPEKHMETYTPHSKAKGAQIIDFYAREHPIDPAATVYHPRGNNSSGYGPRPQLDRVIADSTGTVLFTPKGLSAFEGRSRRR